MRFGTDPAQSVLDLNCKAHEVDNLYVTDASFFPSIGAVNPTLTIIANALRVGERSRRESNEVLLWLSSSFQSKRLQAQAEVVTYGSTPI